MGSELKGDLRALGRALRDVHSLLIDVAAMRYQAFTAAIPSKGALLHLLMNDESFAWLRAMSGLMADLDEMLAGPEPVTPEAARAMRSRTEELLSPSDDPEAFGSRYVALLPFEPELVMAHAALRDALRALPERD